jgi:hypothetical protein
MIYLFAGDDSKKKIANYEKFIDSLGSEVEVFSISKNDFDENQIEGFYSSSGLFAKKSAIVFLNVFEKEEIKDFLLEKLEFMGSSENVFIFMEGKLNKPTLDAFREVRAELNIFELPKEKKEKYDNFILTYDFEKRDKLNLWIHFRCAMDVGVGMEELIGVLFWKGKDMLLRKNFSKFSEAELINFTTKLAYLLPEARKQGLDDETAFEQFLLEAF